MRTYLKLWWYARQARHWGRLHEKWKVATSYAESRMLAYRWEWNRLREKVAVYQTPREREASILSANKRMFDKAESLSGSDHAD